MRKPALGLPPRHLEFSHLKRSEKVAWAFHGDESVRFAPRGLLETLEPSALADEAFRSSSAHRAAADMSENAGNATLAWMPFRVSARGEVYPAVPLFYSIVIQALLKMIHQIDGNFEMPGIGRLRHCFCSR